MKKTVRESVNPETGYDENALREFLLKKYLFPDSPATIIQVTRRSIDARRLQVRVNIEAIIYVDEEPDSLVQYKKEYRDVSGSGRVIIVGSGPAGMFAALRFLEMGIKPVILERGRM